MRTALFLCLVLVVGCGPKAKSQCASNTAGTCITGEQCSYDEKQGCQVCQCAPIDQSHNKDDPFNNGNPDDRTRPPEPVH